MTQVFLLTVKDGEETIETRICSTMEKAQAKGNEINATDQAEEDVEALSWEITSWGTMEAVNGFRFVIEEVEIDA
jgi:hypothetical protein